MKLEMKHLSIEHAGQVVYDGQVGEITKVNLLTGTVQFSTLISDKWVFLEQVKPVRRPLSDLTEVELEEFYNINSVEKGTLKIKSKEIYRDGTSVCWDIKFKDINGIGIKDGYYHTSYAIELRGKYSCKQWNWIYSKHIDVFNLIPQGLAIDINTLEK